VSTDEAASSKNALDPRTRAWSGVCRHGANLARLADTGSSTDDIGKLCLWINGGGNHYDHRHIHFFHINRVLNDTALSPAACHHH
jgi:hypothetical protein